MSQIARQFPDQPERWNAFAGMPKASPSPLHPAPFKSIEEATTAVMQDAKTAMRQASTEIDRLRAENAKLVGTLENALRLFYRMEDLDDRVMPADVDAMTSEITAILNAQLR